MVLVERLDVLVLETGNADASHPEFRDLASDRPWVASKRVNGGDAVDKDRQNKGAQIGREVSEQCRQDGVLGEEGEEDGGCENNDGVDIDVIRLVFAEHLVCRLHW